VFIGHAGLRQGAAPATRAGLHRAGLHCTRAVVVASLQHFRSLRGLTLSVSSRKGHLHEDVIAFACCRGRRRRCRRVGGLARACPGGVSVVCDHLAEPRLARLRLRHDRTVQGLHPRRRRVLSAERSLCAAGANAKTWLPLIARVNDGSSVDRPRSLSGSCFKRGICDEKVIASPFSCSSPCFYRVTGPSRGRVSLVRDELPGRGRAVVLLCDGRAVPNVSRGRRLLPAESARERCGVDAEARRALNGVRPLIDLRVNFFSRACYHEAVALAFCERISPNGRGRGVSETKRSHRCRGSLARVRRRRRPLGRHVQHGVSPMKTSLLSLSAAAFVAIGAMALGAGPARAQVEYPWCSITNLGGGTGTCSYTTHEQCQASILGGAGFCQPNPRASTPAPTQRRRAR
jgi:hypothetical protein